MEGGGGSEGKMDGRGGSEGEVSVGLTCLKSSNESAWRLALFSRPSTRTVPMTTWFTEPQPWAVRWCIVLQRRNSSLPANASGRREDCGSIRNDAYHGPSAVFVRHHQRRTQSG